VSKPVIGKILDAAVEYDRDAIHVPILSVIALEELEPGEKIAVTLNNLVFEASKSKTPVGVVDPFLKTSVKVGEKFYCWVKPSTVHKLWHEWEHPIFDK
jgi:hypothetical protein